MFDHHATMSFTNIYICLLSVLFQAFRYVNLYEKLLSLLMYDEEISLAHGQVPNEISLARSEKALAPGDGQWDMSAPVTYSMYELFFRVK